MGKSFHICGPATEKLDWPIVFLGCRYMTIEVFHKTVDIIRTYAMYGFEGVCAYLEDDSHPDM